MRQHSSRSPMPARLESRVGMPLSAEANSVAGTVIGITGREGGAYIDLNARGADQYFIFSDGFTVDGEGNATFAGDLGAISGTFDIVIGGRWDSASTNPLRGIRLDSSVAKPGTWNDYIDMAAGSGTGVMVQLGGLTVLGNGTTELAGSLNAATGTFAGSLSAATGTFAGSLTAAVTNVDNQLRVFGSTTLDTAFANAITTPLIQAPSVPGTDEITISGEIVTFALSSPSNVTGSRAGNAALASLLSALAGIGLISDGTTA